MQERYEYYQGLVGAVDEAIRLIQEMPAKLCFDQQYIEHELILKLGLNDEMLHEQPAELSAQFGTGLHLWQYPNQLSKYLVWLACNARDVRSYMEIGCRWGGTFIVVMEWLKKIGCRLDFGMAVDLIEPTPFMRHYVQTTDTPILYYTGSSATHDFRDFNNRYRPEMVFIDGDHNMIGVMNDHVTVRKSANIIVHHDISSNACEDSTLFWSYVKNTEDAFNSAEFTDQYASVNGNYLGIGVLKRK